MRQATKCISAMLVLASAILATQANADSGKSASGHAAVNWSLELKAGLYEPAIDNWEQFYGDDKVRFLSASFGYRPLKQLELGMEVGWMRDNGSGFLPANNTQGGNVKYEFVPVSAFVLLRGVFIPEQWVVPYIGGGWTRGYYRASISNQSDIDGVENGTHVRAGLQFLLNKLDRKYAAYLKNNYSISNSWFFIEAHEIKVEVDATGDDLGGRILQAGVLFEFR